MNTIVKYVALDLVRNKIVLVYTLLLATLSFSVLSIDSNTSKGLLSLLNITLLFVPIISILFATIYFFNSIEFIELLLAQPVKRTRVLLAEYTGLASALCLAYALGIGVPVLFLSPNMAAITLLVSGLLLTLCFTAMALLIFVLFKDKTKGIGAAIIIALFFSLLFDGLLLMFIYSFSDYPIDKPILGIVAFNPIDLARILMLLQLDVAVLMGYSGALFKKFLGSATGSIYAVTCMLFWVIVPLMLSRRVFKRKDL
ncbi:MAG: ABC transporter permease subunit [Bacteroidetes bacterium]|nr:ABC transporter permease subunit [Bacteroidota bacterium]